MYQDKPAATWKRLACGTVDLLLFSAGLEDMSAESLKGSGRDKVHGYVQHSTPGEARPGSEEQSPSKDFFV